MNKDYSVCIKVSPEVYDKYKKRLEDNGIATLGHYSRIGKTNRYCFEWAVDNMSDEVFNKMVEDLI